MVSSKALLKLSVRELEALVAAKRLEEKAAPLIRKRERIAAALEKLDKRIGGIQIRALVKRVVRKPKKAQKRRLSPAARARIVAAQNRRWAKFRKAKKAGKPRKAKKAKAAPQTVPQTTEAASA